MKVLRIALRFLTGKEAAPPVPDLTAIFRKKATDDAVAKVIASGHTPIGPATTGPKVEHADAPPDLVAVVAKEQKK